MLTRAAPVPRRDRGTVPRGLLPPETAWPQTPEGLASLQRELGRDAAAVLVSSGWVPRGHCLVGGCFVAGSRGRGGRGHSGDRLWAAAVVWRTGAHPPPASGPPGRRTEDVLRGRSGALRRATDVVDQVVAEGTSRGPYLPGLLALRQGPIIAEVVSGLVVVPDVMIVDGTGLDHPRHGGLAVHVGAATGIPTVGVTNRPLVGTGAMPPLERARRSPLTLDGELVGYWVCTREGARPVLAHAGWRTSPGTAAEVVLLTSTSAARTPVPLQEARRLAREARASASSV